MARPRVFISSTYYNLKHVRASLEVFVDTLGFDSVLFEKGDIAFDPDKYLDASCYDEARSADIFVLIVGGRHGSPATGEPAGEKEFYTKYNSVTEREFDAAHAAGVPIYIVVEKAVHAEYETFKLNRDNDNIRYAHVESIGVFMLLDSIYSKTMNNNVYQFERSTDISLWLRTQWAGLFRDMLKIKGQSRQLGDLNAQVSQLEAANNTLKAYLEELLTNLQPEKSKIIIADQAKKQDIANLHAKLRVSGGKDYYNWLVNMAEIPYQYVVDFIVEPNDYDEVIRKLKLLPVPDKYNNVIPSFVTSPLIKLDYNRLRRTAGRPYIDFPNIPGEWDDIMRSESNNNASITIVQPSPEQ